MLRWDGISLIGDGDGAQHRIVTGVGTEIDAQDVDARLYGCATGLSTVPIEEVVQALGDRRENGYFAPGEVEDIHSRFAVFDFEDDKSHC